MPPLETVADVRRFLKHVPAEHRQFKTWRHVESEADQAEQSGDTLSLTVALEVVLVMNGLMGRRG